jgi:hypothetical protein
VEYLENLDFQRLIGRYQILLGILLALFAFLLGLGNYWAALVAGLVSLVTYIRYEMEWDKIKQRIGKIWNNADQRSTDRTIKKIKENRDIKKDKKA